MLDSIITSKTRVRLLLKFFLNSDTRAYLRSLAEEFNESTNSIRVELNRLSEAGLLTSENEGNTVLYQANVKHPLFGDIQSIIKKMVGIDKILEHILVKLGNVKQAYVTGDYAQGKDSGIIDLMLVGEINQVYLLELIGKVEKVINRKIRFVIFSEKEFKEKASLHTNVSSLLIFE